MRTAEDLTSLKGIGEKTKALFEKLGITDTQCLLEHYPRQYDLMQEPVTVSELVPDQVCAVKAAVIGSPVVRRIRSLVLTTVQAGDATGLFRLTFFGMPYLKKVLQPGSFHVFRGICRRESAKSGLLKMEQPRIFSVAEYESLAGTLQPRYALTAGLTNHMVQKAVSAALQRREEEFLPEAVRREFGLLSWQEALQKIHCPASFEDVEAARKRLSFQEFLLFFLTLRLMKEDNQTRTVQKRLRPVPDTGLLLSQLPYRLTEAQKRAWREIERDLCSETAMNRLVQGDVGSGKTILAFLALLLCAANQRQGCLMAPTEVLAAQHYETLLKMKKQYGLCVEPVLLTGSLKAAQRRDALKQIASGEANVIIGTHALIQEKVNYRDLALVVTDEQHRFGVRQREILADKGEGTHVLVMSATPIPRTLAIVLYGDLQVSVLDELPAGRRPIKNCVIGVSQRPRAYAFLVRQILEGHQVYCICPMVEEGELEGLENVTDYAAQLDAALASYLEKFAKGAAANASIRIQTLHGKMKPAQKTRIMEEFSAGKTDLLVSTTVVEVGINVPNATVMLVENAERFGLAQLHQLRGRVGRGDAQSYCIFISASDDEQVMKRLQILNTSNDGFQIANEDLKLRGPGDLFGIRQSGQLDFKIGDIYQDSELLLKASSLADRIFQEDPKRVREEWLPLYRLIEEKIRSNDFRGM